MGIFRDLGRRAERFKRQVESAADATHECSDCGELIQGEAEHCPSCGSADLVAIE